MGTMGYLWNAQFPVILNLHVGISTTLLMEKWAPIEIVEKNYQRHVIFWMLRELKLLFVTVKRIIAIMTTNVTAALILQLKVLKPALILQLKVLKLPQVLQQPLVFLL